MKESKLIKTNNAVIKGIVACIPQNVITNNYFESFLEIDVIKNISKSIGVNERRWIKKETNFTYDLCTTAARDLLTNLDWDSSSIDCVIFITQTHSKIMPAEACIIQNELNIPEASLAFDINLGCSGYAYGCMLANSLINTGLKRILVLAGETPSRIIDPYDKATSLLFGDAGTATAIEKSLNNDENTFLFGTNGIGKDHIQCANNGFLKMNGADVFSFTLDTVPKLISKLDNTVGKEHDFYLLHQANAFMLKHLIRKTGLGKERFPTNINKFGNVSSASIPLLIASELKNVIIEESKLLSCIGFGVGLSWSAMSFNSKSIVHLNVLEESI